MYGITLRFLTGEPENWLPIFLEQSVKTTKKSHHFYLIAGQVIFASEGGPQAVLQNTMLREDTSNFGLHQIAKAQQGLQQTLFNKLGGPVEVVDVIITNVNYLGLQTEKQFNKLPQSMTLQEIRGDDGQLQETTVDIATTNIVEVLN